MCLVFFTTSHVFFFASKHMGKIKGKNAVSGTLFCLAEVLAAHGLPKHLSDEPEVSRTMRHATVVAA